MALQIRRGVDGSGAGGRLTITPSAGELLYTTDTKRLYIGDGTTVGGNIITGSGLTNVIEDTSPQLGGDLDIQNFNIITTGNTDLTLVAGSTGNIYLGGNITRAGGLVLIPSSTNAVTTPAVVSVGDPLLGVDGNFAITKTVYSAAPGAGFSYSQHHTNSAAVPTLFWRTRGTSAAPAAVLNNDRLSTILFSGHDGTNPVVGAGIGVTVSGSVTTGNVPSKITFLTNNGSSLATRAELTTNGAWKINEVQNFSGASLNISGSGTVVATAAIIGNGAASPAAGTILTVTGTLTGGTLAVGNIISGGGILFGTAITAVNSATFVSTINTTTMTVSSVSVGTIAVGMALSGGSVTAGTYVVAFVSGVNGGAGVYTLNQTATGTPTTGTRYTVSISQLAPSTTITSGGTVNLVGNVRILGQSSLRFADADSSNYVAFQSPATVAANVTWTLPAADGTGGQFLSTNGSGTLSWATQSVGIFSAQTDVASAGLTVDEIYLPAITRLVVTANGVASYRFDQYRTTDNPTVYAIGGTTIAFDISAVTTAHPFLIRTSSGINFDEGLVHVSTTGVVSTGSSAQGKSSGTLYWKVPASIFGDYQYICGIHPSMVGVITIKDISAI